MDEVYDHLSYASRQSAPVPPSDIEEDSAVYELISPTPGRSSNTGSLPNGETDSAKAMTLEKKKLKDKCTLFLIPTITAVVLTGLVVCVVIVIMLASGNKMSQQQLLLNAENRKEINETIQIYLEEEIKKLGKSITTKLDSEISKLNQSFQNVLHNSNKVLTNENSLLPSCAAIVRRNPSSPSGYYSIYSSTLKENKVYCDMTKTCGDSTTRGWTRVVQLNISDPSSNCPPDLCLNSAIRRTCQTCGTLKTCSSDVFTVQVNYSRVCGRILGYQIGPTDGLEQNPVDSVLHHDGIDLTYGVAKKHIWTFAVARAELYHRPRVLCQCIDPDNSKIPLPPSYVGVNYFCDTAAIYNPKPGEFLSNNTLWDGIGCSNKNQCCSYNNPPWFFRELPQSTNDDIEMSVCRTGNQIGEDIAIESIDIYVQ